MDGVLDLERLLGRVALDSAGPREVMSLAATLACLPRVVAAVKEFAAVRWTELGASVDPLEDLHEMIVKTIAEEPPVSLGDGGAIRTGVDAELDELRELGRSGRQALAAIEERERQRTGIGSLKVRFNNVFGYYLEVTKANAKAVPADYERKQTLVNAERFTTPELKEYETKILTAQERSGEIERRIFGGVATAVAGCSGAGCGRRHGRLPEIDLLGCFAHLMPRCVDGSGLLLKRVGCSSLCKLGIRWWNVGWRSRAAEDLCRIQLTWMRMQGRGGVADYKGRIWGARVRIFGRPHCWW